MPQTHNIPNPVAGSGLLQIHRWGRFCDMDETWYVLQSWYKFTYSTEYQALFPGRD